jgi:hypothetical protein
MENEGEDVPLWLSKWPFLEPPPWPQPADEDQE